VTSGDTPGSTPGPRADRGQLAWSVIIPIGATPAVLFHDYGGTLLVVGFLFVFWIFVQRWILSVSPSSDIEVVT
jgi:hypothetical protein